MTTWVYQPLLPAAAEVQSAVTTGQIKVWNGSAWVAKPVKVWTGTNWTTKPVKYWNGSTWVVTPY